MLAPDALVLAAGGIAGEAWMTGVLAGIEDAHGLVFARTEQLVGTSAGAIIAAVLAAGEPLRRPPAATEPDGDAPPDAPGQTSLLAGGVRALASAAWAASAPLTTSVWARGAGLGALGRALAFTRLPSGGQSLDRLRTAPELARARFDGRLRIVAVDRDSGRRVVFGAPGAPPAPVGAAVAASCAVPGIFAPVAIGGRTYVDGGAWSLTNLDVPRIGRDTHILCLNVFGAMALRDTPPALAALRAGARVSEAVEAQIVRRRGGTLRTIVPDAGSVAAIAGRLMDRGRAAPALTAGYAQGRALGG
jgi:NTE family protein